MVKAKELKTEIVIEPAIDTPYPYCPLPDPAFAARELRAHAHGRTLLSVTTWDGRSIMQVETK